MKQAIIVAVCLGLALGSASCAAPVALGAAVVGAGAGAQAGWWFGKSSKQDAQAKEKQEKKEAPHVGAKSQ